MKKLLFLVAIILLITVSAVSAAENVTEVETDAGDDLCQDVDSLSPEIPICGESDGVEVNNDSNGNDEGNDSSQVTYSIQGEDLVWYYNANPVYTFQILDSNGHGVLAENVKITINNKVYNVTTDENGKGSFSLSKFSAG